jgi:hypothetical protein
MELEIPTLLALMIKKMQFANEAERAKLIMVANYIIETEPRKYVEMDKANLETWLNNIIPDAEEHERGFDEARNNA